MNERDELLTALGAAVDADPENDSLRAHFAGMLLLAGDAQRALVHAEWVLSRRPYDVDSQAVLEGARALCGQGAAARTEVPTQQGCNDDLVGLARPDEPTVTFADVAGMTAVKQRLHDELLAPLRNPQLRDLYGTSTRGGMLLYGAPGCGKTLMARALAGELGARFFSIGLTDVLSMWFGESERWLHAIFEEARECSPSVLFFDEVDALGHRRSNLRPSAGRGVVVQLLAELDGFDTDNEGLYVLGATNAPWDVDPALLRPGRFDRTMLVLPPDFDARVAILHMGFEDRPVGGDVDLRSLAAKTEGWSGADLAALCTAAARLALRRAVLTHQPGSIGMNDLLEAHHDMRPTTDAWFDTARSVALYSNDDGLYGDLKEALGLVRRKRR